MGEELAAGAGSVVGASGEDPGPLVEDVRVWAATGVEVVVGAGDGAVWVGVAAVVREGGDVMRVVMAAGEPGERSVAGVPEVGRGGAELEPAATAEVALGAWVARVPAVGAGEEPPEEVPAGLVEREGAGVLRVLVNMDVTPGPVAAVGTVPEVTAGALCGVPGAAVVTLSVVASRVAWDAGGVGRVAVVAEAGAEVAGPGLVSEVAPVGGAELAGAGREVVWVAGVPLGELDPGLVLEVQAGAGSVVGAGGEDPGPLVEDVRVWAATGVEVVVGAGDGAVWVGVAAVVREGGDAMRVVMAAGEPGERSVAGVPEVGRGGAELEPAATAEVALGAWVARVPAVGGGRGAPGGGPRGAGWRGRGAGVLRVLVNMDVTPGPVAAVGTVPEVTAGALCGVPGAAVVTLSVVASRVAWDAGGVGRVAVVAEAGAEVAGPGLVSEVAPGVPLGELDPGLVLEVQAGAGSVVGAGGEDPGPLVEDVRVWAATGVEVVVGAGDGAVWVGVAAVVREGGDVMRVVMAAGEPGERSVAGVPEVGARRSGAGAGRHRRGGTRGLGGPGLVLEVQAGAGSVVGAGGEDPGPLVEDVRVWAATGVEVVVGAGDGAVWVGVAAVVREGGDVMRVVMAAGEPGER
ncbi:elastin-like [Phacochoerus africanus]|uniref:elastin-like n=1 Tax=Phacochoerus africanus TaxID=41426 RepID=UPI001FDA91DE|nr:elastin-like [Phacochoerus africanus]